MNTVSIVKKGIINYNNTLQKTKKGTAETE